MEPKTEEQVRLDNIELALTMLAKAIEDGRINDVIRDVISIIRPIGRMGRW